MTLTTAGRREKLPLKEARLTIDIGGYIYTGWFVVYKLAKYDLILGKNWMEEIPQGGIGKKDRRARLAQRA